MAIKCECSTNPCSHFPYRPSLTELKRSLTECEANIATRFKIYPDTPYRVTPMRHEITSPYRTNSPPTQAPTPMKLYRQRHPRLWKIIECVIGVVGLVISLPALWLLFPGVYKLGVWVNSTVFHLNLPLDCAACTSGINGLFWVIGLALLLLPVLALGLSRCLGEVIIYHWDQK